MKKNITLVGMPGVGKSTIGVVLAKILGYQFIDSDLLIQEAENKLLREIISEKGIEGFLEVENRVNASIEADHSIISTGGSAIYCKEAMKHLSEIGKIVYLKLDYENLKKRLGDIEFRGVVMPEGYDLKMLYDERTVLYEKYADIIIDTNGLGVEETIRRITRILNSMI